MPRGCPVSSLPGRHQYRQPHARGAPSRRQAALADRPGATAVSRGCGVSPRAVQITRDITELRAALEAAQISKLAFEAAGEGIVVTDSDGAMIEVNPAFSRITGYPRQVAMGLKVSILSVAERGSQALAGMLEVVAASGSWEGELPSRRQSGEEFVAFYRISCLADAGGASATSWCCSSIAPNASSTTTWSGGKPISMP